MSTLTEVIRIVGSVLQIGDRIKNMTADTHLLGSIPEFDSMAVVAVITALEDGFGIVMDDDEIDATIFETVGDLTRFLDKKLNEE